MALTLSETLQILLSTTNRRGAQANQLRSIDIPGLTAFRGLAGQIAASRIDFRPHH